MIAGCTLQYGRLNYGDFWGSCIVLWASGPLVRAQTRFKLPRKAGAFTVIGSVLAWNISGHIDT